LETLPALLGILIALTLGTMSPGPSFIMIAKTSVACSRMDGLFAALGIGVGGLVLAASALLGLAGLLLTVTSAYLILKVFGGLYLTYLGLRFWQSAKLPLKVEVLDSVTGNATPTRSFVLGLSTQLSNPKAIIVYASVYAAFLPAVSTPMFNVVAAALTFFIEVGWFSLVAFALSSERPRTAYLRYKQWIDRAAGGMMVALGIKLASTANRP
jgi:threonine/homoserine/homoserine lactone efflux protein